MTIDGPSLSPPQMLALRYAPTAWRDELRILLLFDARMQSVVTAGREPLLTRMKLAWWREALSKCADQRPRGEPLLAEISAIEIGVESNIATTAASLVDAWEEMADPEFVDDDAIERHKRSRGDAIFGHFAGRVADAQSLQLAGRIWSGAELNAIMPALPRHARALTLLCHGSVVERQRTFFSLARYFWHALTGR